MYQPKLKRFASVALSLVMVMTVVFGSGFHFTANAAAPSVKVSDRVEISVNGGDLKIMNVYKGGFFEAQFIAGADGDSYSIYINGVLEKTATVTTAAGTAVYVRFSPFSSGETVLDSVNNKSSFTSMAAFAGTIRQMRNLIVGGSAFTDWSTSGSGAALLTYVGGGIYSRTFQFINPVATPINLQYKVAFNGTWDYSIGNNGANVSVTIPVGTQSFKVWADGVNGVCFDSISAPGFNYGESFSSPAGGLTVELMSETESLGTFSQVAPDLFALNANMPSGSSRINYTVRFNGTVTRTGTTRLSSMSNGGNVMFAYDTSNDVLVDSRNNEVKMSTLLGFYKLPTAEELDAMAYSGALGAIYTPEFTAFKVWAPTASDVSINFYAAGNGGAAYNVQPMEKLLENDQWTGVWYYAQMGDQHGVYYTYSVTTASLGTRETGDVYANAAGLNGNRSMVVDLSRTNPAGWDEDEHVAPQQITDSLIWEVHVRDWSMSAESGMSDENRGKYLAFTERGTTVNNDGVHPTGIDYLRELGVNYVHILPSFDQDNNEATPTFNWGYNPKNYNVPEGSYSSDPYNGAVRINEYKQMVAALHKAGIGVIFDCVYNHVASAAGSWFNYTVPQYYFRYNASGALYSASGCGNDTASEHAMFSKYMVDSVLYWATEYHIDGFRFDLMGLHDVDTMNAIRTALDNAGLQHVIMYGEGWDMASYTLPGGKAFAKQRNSYLLKDGIAMFNDNMRDSAKGFYDQDYGIGFVQGGKKYSGAGTTRAYSDQDMIAGITSSTLPELNTSMMTAWAVEPQDTITYTSCHDDLTLWDKLYISMNGKPGSGQGDLYLTRDDNVIASNKMAAALNFTSQGLSFIHAGEEWGRTKQGNSNSYNSGDAINMLLWSQSIKFADLVDYYKGMIAINKAYSPIRDTGMGTIQTMSFSSDTVPNLISYTMRNTLSDSEWDTMALIYNSSYEEQQATLTVKTGDVPQNWVVIANGDKAGVAELGRLQGSTITVPARSTMILVDADSFDAVPVPAITSVQVSTPTLVATLAANLVVNVTGDNLEGKTLTASIDVGEASYSAAVAGGKGIIKIPANPDFVAGDYTVTVTVSGGKAGSCTVRVVPYNTNIWSCNAQILDSKLLIHFNDDIALKSGVNAVTVAGKLYSAAVLSDLRTVEVLNVDTAKLAASSTITVKGVKYPALFPSYSFTFTCQLPGGAEG